MKEGQCPYCNASLELLTEDWHCLHRHAYGTANKHYEGKCKDKNSSELLPPLLIPAQLKKDGNISKELSGLMRRQSKLMNSVIRFIS